MNALRWALFGIMAIVSLAAGFVTPHDPAHNAGWNMIPAFFALFGFFGCLLIIFIAKSLGKIFLQKGENYYDAD